MLAGTLVNTDSVEALEQRYGKVLFSTSFFLFNSSSYTYFFLFNKKIRFYN